MLKMWVKKFSVLSVKSIKTSSGFLKNGLMAKPKFVPIKPNINSQRLRKTRVRFWTFLDIVSSFSDRIYL